METPLFHMRMPQHIRALVESMRKDQSATAWILEAIQEKATRQQRKELKPLN